MLISNLIDDINIFYPNQKKKLGKKELSKLIESRNGDRLSVLGSEIPRIFFEPLFLQEPERLKEYIVGEQKGNEFFYNKLNVPGSTERPLEEWEDIAIDFSAPGFDGGDESDDSDDSDDSEDSDDENDTQLQSKQIIVMKNIDKQFSKFFSQGIYFLFKYLIEYLFVKQNESFRFVNCIPIFIKSSSVSSIKSTIIYFGIYTKQNEGDNPTMTHYDFLYFKNGKKISQQYQDNIVSFLKQVKRDENVPLSRINPIILNN